uniref:Uncharacterized protein n=1 Tax=Ceratitis capitata TaxID=7213 RepID=W8B9T6_CERCA
MKWQKRAKTKQNNMNEQTPANSQQPPSSWLLMKQVEHVPLCYSLHPGGDGGKTAAITLKPLARSRAAISVTADCQPADTFLFISIRCIHRRLHFALTIN